MASRRFHERWLVPACTSALLTAFLLLVVLSFLPGTPRAVAAICFILTAPLFLMSVVFVSKLSLDFGISEDSRGELEQLIAKKQRGELQRDTPEIWVGTAHIVGVMVMPSKTIPIEPAACEMLDRLVDWKRSHGLPPTEAEDDYWQQITEITAAP